MRTIVVLLIIVVFCTSAWGRPVPVVELDGPIGPVAVEYLAEVLSDAARARDALVIVRLDTPGGLDGSMREIVRDILGSPVPVIAWVGPSGARAASAGLFILAAASAAGMAPGTNVGAAHPMAIGVKDPSETASKKIEADASAYIRSLAEQRGRDPEWFELAVRESSSLSAQEALERGVVDDISQDLPQFLAALDGRSVSVLGRKVRLATKGLEPEVRTRSLRQRILGVLADPNVAYLLLMFGFFGLFFELANPGSMFPGVLGGLCLILAFFGLQTLPFDYAGVLLLLLGLVLLLLEIKVTSFGLLSVGGAVCLVLGSLMLFKSSEAYAQLSLAVVLPVVGATVAFFLLAVGKGLAAQRKKPVSGADSILGERGKALQGMAPGRAGKVVVHGEYWAAVSSVEIPPGAEIEVLSARGMELTVGPCPKQRRE